MNKITGYLEIDGNIFKITSVDELKEFVVKIGCTTYELSEKEFIKLCMPDPNLINYIKDDCGGVYSSDGGKLLLAPICSEEYKVRDGTTIITDDAFRWYKDWNGYKYGQEIGRETHRISRIYLPDTVIAIGNNSFMDNQSLTNIEMSSELICIGENAFSGCINLSNFVLPQTLKYIGANAFEEIPFLSEVIIGNNVLKIGSHAFKNCVNLEVVSLPFTIEALGSGVFEGCNKLREIRIPKGSTEKYSRLLPFSTDKFVEIEVD